ncbi:MAG TPA: biotin/lipoyl-binding protein, partial [Myxococcaceae bacterium]|nr:biotin/lipoyl-binding protein [Myxococcaceae bacterium]
MPAAPTTALRDTSPRDHAPREAPAVVPELPPAPPAKVRFAQRRSTKVFAGLTALAAVGALGAWVLGHGKESTDDAQVEGRVVSVGPRVSGQVEKVLVIDNQSVKQGDLIVQLDPKDLDAKLASARADLESAKAGLATAQVNLKLTEVNSDASLRQARGGLTVASSSVASTRSALAQAKAEVEAAEAADRLAQADWTRAQDLAKAEAISRADVDARRSRADQARAQL